MAGACSRVTGPPNGHALTPHQRLRYKASEEEAPCAFPVRSHRCASRLRFWRSLSDGTAVELTSAARGWAATSQVDAGRRQVVQNGLRILWDPQEVLSQPVAAVRFGAQAA
jgi:hypothetical protein